MTTQILTQERLRSLLDYDPMSGDFRWRVNRTAGVKVGDLAGSQDNEGYRLLSVDGRLYKAHRVAWLYMTGIWPPHVIDHIDQNPSNNAFSNLRLASTAQNGMNRRMDKRNRTGVTGVTWCTSSQKWRADIGENGKLIRLGRFDTLLDAVAARKLAERKHRANDYIQR